MDGESTPYQPSAGQAQTAYLDAGRPLERAGIRRPHSPLPSDGPSKSPAPRTRRPRVSVFKELDVDTMPVTHIEDPQWDFINNVTTQPIERLRNQSDLFDSLQSANSPTESQTSSESCGGMTVFPGTDTEWSRSWRAFSSSRLMTLALILILAMPILYDTPLLGKAGPSIIGAKAGVIQKSEIRKKDFVDGQLVTRQQVTDSDTSVCNRWSHQSALINGTIYIYGGRSTTDASQTSNEWNNNFLTIDVTKSWEISSPNISGLPVPSGPPAVANGYLWNSYDSLYLYGGEFQDSPAETPVAYSMWEYNISGSSWTEHQNPQTAAGNNSDSGNQPVLGSAEGAGISVPELGRGWYFAGHEDHFTTPGWSIDIFRVYLKSLLEFTFPGYTNDGVQSLGGGKTAGSDGVWRNITQGGIQNTSEFPSRADSVLVYVPGYGVNGILVGIAGGNNLSFNPMNVIDVFDIASSTWYKQSTSGKYPILRVNPCAVAASAPDGSSTNIYMFGGQNLFPFENQTQYSDTWILTIPSFTWIEVDTNGQSVPPGRTGHSCNIWDGQMIVVGGYTGPQTNGLGCDSGFYVFSTTNLTWQNNFNSLSGGNTLNQQSSQQEDPSALSGSYDYQVPVAVQAVIGGKGSGGATITAPAQSATAGPLATGKPITYTVTAVNGAVVTETGTSSTTPGSSVSTKAKGGPNVAAIVAGVVAGCFALLAGYLAFCVWIYRRQLALYKNHVAMTQRAAAAGGAEKAPFLPSSEVSSARDKWGTDQSSRQAGSGSGSAPGASGSSGYEPAPPLPGGMPVGGNSTANSSTENLLGEPTFFGVLLNPRRSLRVVNRD